METKRKRRKPPPADALGEVVLYEGQGVAEMVREADPEGTVVVHARRRDATVCDRMLRSGSITRQMHEASERFRTDFERGRLIGRYGSVRIGEGGGRGGVSEESFTTVAARQRVNHALRSLGAAEGMTQRVIWSVVGEQQTLDEFAQRLRWAGLSMDPSKASGLLIGGLERLAVHYGIISHGDLHGRSRQGGFIAGLRLAASVLQLASEERRPKRVTEALAEMAVRLETMADRRQERLEGRADA